MSIVNKIALILVIVGAINWGAVALFSFDAVAWISGGGTTILAKIIYLLVAIAGLWCISLLFQDNEIAEHHA